MPPKIIRGNPQDHTRLAGRLPGESHPSDHPMDCLVCAQTLEPAEQLLMPCCGKIGGSAVYCRACMIKLTKTNSGCRKNGINVGLCPSCREPIRLFGKNADDLVVYHFKPCDVCGTIYRESMGVNDIRLCSTCITGCINQFLYECQACGGVQRSPAGLWFSQDTPLEYSRETWPCIRCAGSPRTHWRLLPCQLQKIPHQFVPAHWGIGNGTVASFLLRVHRLELMFNIIPLRVVLYLICPLLAHTIVIAAFAFYYAETGWAIFVESGTCVFVLLAFVYMLDNVGFERGMQVLRSFFFVAFVTVHVCFNAPAFVDSHIASHYNIAARNLTRAAAAAAAAEAAT